MGEETPSQPKTAKQLEKEAKKAAEKAAKLEKLAGWFLHLLHLVLTTSYFSQAGKDISRQGR